MRTETKDTTPDIPRVRFRDALLFWLKLGFISFGGPAGQIAIMHQELVEKRRWISESRFLHALNYCMLLPGPEAQQLATYLGWLMHRSWGGIVAGSLFVLPSLLILIGLSWIYMAHGHQPLIAAVFWGIKPAVTAIVLHAAWRIGSRTLNNGLLWAIALAAFAAIFFLHVPFPAIVIGAAVLGLVGSRFAPTKFSGRPHGDTTGVSGKPEAAATLPHTRFRWSRLASVLIVGVLLWSLPMAGLVLVFGWDHLLTQMGWFFTKAALLTFGGAYAVLPYVYQGAVEHFGWLTAAQMIDGLALGETTPGPLIMVLAYVGFIGGWGKAIFGPDALLLAGVTAAMIVTWFTFLPSFVFILAGGPLVESTHGKLAFTAPLTAVTAAVVGVILNLALFFAGHVLWPAGFDAALDAGSAAIMLAAALALIRFKRGVVQVIGGAAASGLLLHWLT
ncbi:MAG: chromate efflux transporter [Zoogloeaceae bacterium]|nr:chromate efflux transporter [Zoogloeaceae bacterium]